MKKDNIENNKKEKYYIFGAHSRGQTLAVYLNKVYPDCELLGYLYDNDEENLAEVDGVPVYRLQGAPTLDIFADVYVGTRGANFEHAGEVLKRKGFKQVFYYNVALDNKLRNIFIPDYFKEHGWNYIRLDEVISRSDKSVISESANRKNTVFVVKSVFDTAIGSSDDLNYYETYIQAGRALTDTDISECRFRDDERDNISDRNKQMCELTAMYWIWKNIDQDIVGIEHYRRRFILPDNWTDAFADGSADVVLPVPLYVNPTLKSNYYQRHTACTWEAMERVLEQIHPECAEDAKRFLANTSCYSPCNLMITRKSVFDELCEWLFPVIFKVMDKCGTLDDSYQNRYPGFLAERLITFFFHMKRDTYKVVYVDKVFLE